MHGLSVDACAIVLRSFSSTLVCSHIRYPLNASWKWGACSKPWQPFGDCLKVRGRVHANNQSYYQMRAAGGCGAGGVGGLSHGGGDCPMCRLSDGEKRSDDVRTQCYAERDCRHAATRQHMWLQRLWQRRLLKR